MKTKVILSLSGGMDSTTVLAFLLERGYEVLCYSFTYGSKHNQYENKAAQDVADFYKVPLLGTIDLSGITKWLKSDLLLSGGDIPEGHYADETMAKTVVPGRNIIFISVLSAIASSCGAAAVAVGIHQGDHAIYADCRTEFYKAMNLAILEGTDQQVSIKAPFLYDDKVGILKYGTLQQVPYELTRTCYKDQPLACGKCGACVERLEAFSRNGLKDPVEYEK